MLWNRPQSRPLSTCTHPCCGTGPNHDHPQPAPTHAVEQTPIMTTLNLHPPMLWNRPQSRPLSTCTHPCCGTDSNHDHSQPAPTHAVEQTPITTPLNLHPPWCNRRCPSYMLLKQGVLLPVQMFQTAVLTDL